MKNKAFLIILLVSVLAVSGCASADEKPKTSGEVMKVAKYYWPGQFWIEIADEKGWFEEAGLNVELVDTNLDYYQSLQDFVDGKIDYNNAPLFDIMLFNSQDNDLVMVVNADISFGADAIVSKPEIESISELRGKRVGVGIGTFTEYILDVVLGQNGLNLDDVELVDVSAENPNPFINGEIDAFATWEPTLSKAIEEGKGHKIFDTSEIPGILPEGATFHKSFIDEKPEDVQAFVDVWHRTTELIKSNPEDAFGIIAKLYGVPVEDVQGFAGDVKILDFAENKIAFSYAAGFESLHGTARQINDFMIEKGITDKKLDTLDFIDARFIRGVE